MASPGLGMVRYAIDTRVSQFTVQAFASGLIAVIAQSPKIAIRDWTGEIVKNANQLDAASITVRIKAASLEVLDELRDDDRRELHRVMNDEVLETRIYPDVAFQSTEAKMEKLREDLFRVRVRGKLQLHGANNDLAFGAQVSIGADSARAFGEFTVRQSDYNIRIASVAKGSLKLQDELKLSFYVVARKQE